MISDKICLISASETSVINVYMTYTHINLEWQVHKLITVKYRLAIMDVLMYCQCIQFSIIADSFFAWNLIFWSHCTKQKLGADTVPACDHVRLLGVIILADLSPDCHVSIISSAFFYWQRQLWRVRRSLDDKSAAILIHAFVMSRVDYCNLLLAGAPKSMLPTSCSGPWTLQRELWMAQISMTAAWHTCFTLSYIGSMWQI